MQVGPGSNEQFIINTTFSPPVCGGVRSQQGDLLEVGALLAISLIPWLNGLSPCALLVLDLGCALIQFSFLGSPQSSIIHHPSSIIPTIHHPSFPPSIIPTIHHPYPSPIIRHPPSTIHHPSSMQRLRTCVCLSVSSFSCFFICVRIRVP
jgi:hypothetical protein